MSLWMIRDASVTVSDTVDRPLRTRLRAVADDIPRHEAARLCRYIRVTVSDTEGCP
jgi:hypothetical protein